MVNLLLIANDTNAKALLPNLAQMLTVPTRIVTADVYEGPRDVLGRRLQPAAKSLLSDNFTHVLEYEVHTREDPDIDVTVMTNDEESVGRLLYFLDLTGLDVDVVTANPEHPLFRDNKNVTAILRIPEDLNVNRLHNIHGAVTTWLQVESRL